MKEEIVVTYFIVAITMHSVSKLAFDFTYPPELLDEKIQDIFPNILNAYSDMKGYDPEEAFEMFAWVIEKLTYPMKAVCECHDQHPSTYNAYPPSIADKANPCLITKVLEDLTLSLNACDFPKRDILEILTVFSETYPKDTYITLIEYFIDEKIEQPAILPSEYRKEKHISILANLSRHALTELMQEIGPILYFLKWEVNQARSVIQRIPKDHIDRFNFLKPYRERMSMLESYHRDIRWFVVKLFMLLGTQNIWNETAFTMIMMQFHFAMFNILIMLLMYYYPILMFKLLLYIQILFCNLYKTLIGCPCRFKSFFTFLLLKRILDEWKIEERKLVKHRYRKRK